MKDSLPNHPARTKAVTLSILGLWFLLALACSVLGVFDSKHRPPAALGAAAVLPVFAFLIWYRRSNEFRQFIQNVDLRILTLAQTWRVGGIIFLMLYWRGVLPGAFALSAGWGDVAIGATAPLIAWAIASRRNSSHELFVFWNLFGIADLITAVSLGVLSSATPLGILAGEATTEVMGQFPLSLIPTFLVPLFLIFHLISLRQIRALNMQPI